MPTVFVRLTNNENLTDDRDIPVFINVAQIVSIHPTVSGGAMIEVVGGSYLQVTDPDAPTITKHSVSGIAVRESPITVLTKIDQAEATAIEFVIAHTEEVEEGCEARAADRRAEENRYPAAKAPARIGGGLETYSHRGHPPTP